MTIVHSKTTTVRNETSRRSQVLTMYDDRKIFSQVQLKIFLSNRFFFFVFSVHSFLKLSFLNQFITPNGLIIFFLMPATTVTIFYTWYDGCFHITSSYTCSINVTTHSIHSFRWLNVNFFFKKQLMACCMRLCRTRITIISLICRNLVDLLYEKIFFPRWLPCHTNLRCPFGLYSSNYV